MGNNSHGAAGACVVGGRVPVTAHLRHPQAPARAKTTRNLHAAIARRHWFNAHYVHDRASLPRRFGA
jgi:hypothetical protein